MAKNDSSVKLDSEGMPFIPGFSDAKGVEMDLGKLFFKPRIVPVHSIAQGYGWNVQEFPNHVNEDTGEIMKAIVMKVTGKAVPVADQQGNIVMKTFGQEIYIPVNHMIREICDFCTLPDVCHELMIVTLEETPLKQGKDKKPKSIRGFRWKILNANVPRADVLKNCVPEKLKAFAALSSENGVKAPSLPARG